MRIAVLQFPGSNCDQDAFEALSNDLKVEAKYVWHTESTLTGFDGVFIPGGFTYGDYLRCGAVASRSSIMAEVIKFANEGRPVIGACNGFQILCESGLLPGALVSNIGQKFVCKDVFLKATNRRSIWTQGCDEVLKIPIAHGEGRYVVSESDLEDLKQQEQIAFQYVNSNGEQTIESNPNGSVLGIAGVLNKSGNVLGMMPHPERATNALTGGVDGLQILKGFCLVTR
jgi:phosphoribosylformylglycinamidine synthase